MYELSVGRRPFLKGSAAVVGAGFLDGVVHGEEVALRKTPLFVRYSGLMGPGGDANPALNAHLYDALARQLAEKGIHLVPHKKLAKVDAFNRQSTFKDDVVPGDERMSRDLVGIYRYLNGQKIAVLSKYTDFSEDTARSSGQYALASYGENMQDVAGALVEQGAGLSLLEQVERGIGVTSLDLILNENNNKITASEMDGTPLFSFDAMEVDNPVLQDGEMVRDNGRIVTEKANGLQLGKYTAFAESGHDGAAYVFVTAREKRAGVEKDWVVWGTNVAEGYSRISRGLNETDFKNQSMVVFEDVDKTPKVAVMAKDRHRSYTSVAVFDMATGALQYNYRHLGGHLQFLAVTPDPVNLFGAERKVILAGGRRNIRGGYSPALMVLGTGIDDPLPKGPTDVFPHSLEGYFRQKKLVDNIASEREIELGYYAFPEHGNRGLRSLLITSKKGDRNRVHVTSQPRKGEGDEADPSIHFPIESLTLRKGDARFGKLDDKVAPEAIVKGL